MSKKIYLEELFDDIRSLSEHYEEDVTEEDVFHISKNEINAFAEDLLKVVKEFMEKETNAKIDEEIDSDDFDDDLFLMDDDLE